MPFGPYSYKEHRPAWRLGTGSVCAATKTQSQGLTPGQGASEAEERVPLVRQMKKAHALAMGLHDTGGGLFSTEARAPSIVDAVAFHFRVRDGNGWFHYALATGR